MVSRLISLLHKEYSTVNQAALLLGVFMFIAQIVGLVRDRLLAGQIGATTELDIYVTAFRIPDLLFALGASLVSVTILIPFLINKMKNGSKQEARAFMDGVFSIFFLSVILVSLVMFFLMPFFAPLVAPGFDAESLTKLVSMSRIMLLSPILLGISNLFGTITQSLNRFLVYALSPILYNAGIVLGILFLYPLYGTTGLALGVVLGAILHLLIQVPVAFKERLMPRFTFAINWVEIRHVVGVSIPRTLALAFNQITVLFLVSIASTISEGSVSIFNFAYVLYAVPFTIIGLSYSVAAFPSLVEAYTEGNMKKFVNHIITPARQIIFWSLPIIALFVVLRAQIVRVILGTGSFGWTETRLTAAALAILAFAVLAQSLINLLLRAYYAAGRTWRPLLVNALSFVATVIFTFVFLRISKEFPEFQTWFDTLMRVSGLPGTRLLMLPLAYTLGALINLIVLWVSFEREFFRDVTHGLWRTFLASFGTALIIGVTSFTLLEPFAQAFNLNTLIGVFLQGFLAGIVGIAFGVYFLIAIKNTEFIDFYTAVHSKFWKTSIFEDDKDTNK